MMMISLGPLPNSMNTHVNMHAPTHQRVRDGPRLTILESLESLELIDSLYKSTSIINVSNSKIFQ